MFISIFLIYLYIKEKVEFWVPLTAIIISVLTHPLLGAPLVLFFIAVVIGRDIKNEKFFHALSFLYIIGIALLFPILFGINNYLAGYGFPNFGNPLLGFPKFSALFARPFWFIPDAGFLLDNLYHIQYALPLLLVGISILGFILRKQKKLIERLFLYTSIGLFVGAWLLRSWIVFPNLAEFEQGNYPFRLVVASTLFLLPWFFVIFDKWTFKYFKKAQKIIFFLLFSGILMISLYFQYPQKNPKINFPGFNITHYDFDAVRWIEKQNSNDEYIVLANTLLSATAMSEYGFKKYFPIDGIEQFYYSSPSGSPLYTAFQQMVYEHTKREYIEQAMDIANVDKAYFVIHWYWNDFDNIVERAKKNADEWHAIGKDKIYIFGYKKK